MKTVLIIDDEESLRRMLSRIISLEGYTVHQSPSLKEARKLLTKEEINVVLCDVRLQDGNGVAFTVECKQKFPAVEIILMTAFGDVEDGVQAMKNGAFDYIVKANDNGKILPLLSRAMEKVEMKERLVVLEKQVRSIKGFESVIGISPQIKAAKELARKVAATNTTVLLLGETGSGKEVFAQGIHQESNRATKPFIALNCSAFPRDLLESELFGYKAGAFTNAIRDKKGLMEQASGGTLFMDEIGEMPLELQAKLLRVLEMSEFFKIGDATSTKIDIRIIAATNRDLQQEVTAGNFREDLFYRLNVFTILLPPLRERKKDIPLLSTHFIDLFSDKIHQPANAMNPAFAEALKAHSWKGNIRELKNVIERAIILAGREELTMEHLPYDFMNAALDNGTSSLDLATMESMHIRKVLHYTRNNKTEAARLLNIGLATLYRKIEEYHIV